MHEEIYGKICDFIGNMQINDDAKIYDTPGMCFKTFSCYSFQTFHFIKICVIKFCVDTNETKLPYVRENGIYSFF